MDSFELSSTPVTPKVGALDMDRLSFILFGHAAFQYLNAACELGLLELLMNRGPLTSEEIRKELLLEERSVEILLLGSTALGLTVKEGRRYSTAPLIISLSKEGAWRKIKDTVAFEQHIVYEGQADFVDSLRHSTNAGLRRIPGDHPDLYHRLSQHPHLKSIFYQYMRSWSELANDHLVAELDLANATRMLDCGGGDAVNAIALARHNPGIEVTILEIPGSAAVTETVIAEAGLAERISVQPGDMFTDQFPPENDCVLFAHQLVIWTPEENTALLRKAYEALKPGGKVVIFSSISNDAGNGPLIAALDSVYFAAVPAEGGMIYPWSVYEKCLRESGFSSIQCADVPGWTPHGIITATKSCEPPRSPSAF
ncbi:methyltransferase [Streptomyces sp. NPDC127068]|uniref:methyltransferase n=1 Tax=Streptomyces sp. NPDC127068 TaxID=3347127 RepID=UPI0036554503